MFAKKYYNEKEKLDGQRERCRRYYKKHAEEIKDKLKKKYHTEHPNAVYYDDDREEMKK